MKKAYRFMFDKQTGLYAGITYKFLENSTSIAPHFSYGFKTIWDSELKMWNLLPEEKFYQAVVNKDKINEIVEMKNIFIHDQISVLKKGFGKSIEKVLNSHHEQYKELIEVRTEIICDMILLEKRLNEKIFSLFENLNTLALGIDKIIERQDKQRWFKRFINFSLHKLESLHALLRRLF